MTVMSGTGFVPEFTRGDRYRKARELTGQGQKEFAEMIGVSRQTVTNAEKEHSKVRRITTNAWALATGVDREWLETGMVGPNSGDGLPRLDSNQEPSGYLSQQVRRLRIAS